MPKIFAGSRKRNNFATPTVTTSRVVHFTNSHNGRLFSHTFRVRVYVFVPILKCHDRGFSTSAVFARIFPLKL